MNEWQITFWDVGQGDATDIKLPDSSHIVIDTGPFAPTGNPFPLWFADPTVGHPRIRDLILTHTHRDHFGGAMTLCLDGQQQIDNVHLPFDKNIRSLEQLPLEDRDDLPELRKFMRQLKARLGNTNVLRYVKPSVIYDDGALRLRVISAEGSSSTSSGTVNSTGVILLLESVSNPDCPIIVWSGDTLLANVANSSFKSIQGVLTGPHHGKPQDAKPKEPDEKTCYFKKLCSQLAPKVLFVSVGTHNPYDHPFRRYLIAAAQAGIRVCCSEITEQCKSMCATHVYQGSFMLGLQPPPKAIQCRGSMRVLVSAQKGLIFDQCQDEFLEVVREKIPEGNCHKRWP